MEEMLNVLLLQKSTKGRYTFQAVNKTVTKYKGFRKCSCITTNEVETETMAVSYWLPHNPLNQMNAMKVAIRITNL